MALAVLFASGCGRGDGGKGSESPALARVTCAAEADSPRDPSVMVLVHSFAGHTARVGCELAMMFGGRFVRVGDAPFAPLEPTAATSESIAPRLEGVRRLFLGFPIWGAAEPSPPARAMIERLPLSGIQVVPFYTYIHDADPAALTSLADLIRHRGGAPLPPIALLAPFWLPAPALDHAVHHVLADRPDLIDIASEPPPLVACVAGTKETGETCAVPAGSVWLGDFGGEDAPYGYVSPRLVRTDRFEIQRGEVTVGQYARCVTAKRCQPVRYEESECGRILNGDDTRPAPCLSFDAARDYCSFASMRLPTEAEWMRAARGRSTANYPWGNGAIRDAEPLRGNFGEKAATGLPGYSLVAPERSWPSDGAPGLAPPCRYPAGNSPYGVCDLAGNLAEWTVDASGAPALKGGSWLDADTAAFRVGSRGQLSIEHADLSFGMYITGSRCVR